MEANVTAETTRRIEEAAFENLLARQLEQARAELKTTTSELAEMRKITSALQTKEYALTKRVDLLRTLVMKTQADGRTLWTALLEHCKELGLALAIAVKDSEVLGWAGNILVLGVPRRSLSLGTLQAPEHQARIKGLLERLAGYRVEVQVVAV